MDLVDYSEDVFNSIVADYRAFAEALGPLDIKAIPMSALNGDNVTRPSALIPWYKGPTLLAHLETVQVHRDLAAQPLTLPVQWVNRPNLDFRGFAGTIATGVVKPGDRVRVLPSSRESTVTRIVTMDGDLPSAGPAQAITPVLADEIDISRGDVIVAADAPLQVTDQLGVHLLWMSDQAMFPGRQYYLSAVRAPCPAR
jgi:bifunctional enzyme CysN/CysC